MEDAQLPRPASDPDEWRQEGVLAFTSERPKVTRAARVYDWPNQKTIEIWQGESPL
jgi:hypothetical protein